MHFKSLASRLVAFLILANQQTFAEVPGFIPETSMLGSEISWANVGSGFKYGVGFAAGKKRASLMGVKEDGTLWYRMSNTYATPFAFPEGCSGNDCWSSYRPYVQENTAWLNWTQYIAGGATRVYSQFVTPKIIADDIGNLIAFSVYKDTYHNHEVVHTISAPVEITNPGSPSNPNQDQYVYGDTVESLPSRVVDIDAIVMGNKDKVNFNKMLVSTYRQDQSFTLRERKWNYRDNRYEWAAISFPEEFRAYSSTRPRLRAFGPGNSYLAVIIKQAEGLKVLVFEKLEAEQTGLKFLTLQLIPNSVNFHAFDFLLVNENLVMMAYQLQSGQLDFSLGLFANNRFGFVPARQPLATQYRYGEFTLMSHHNEVFAVAKSHLGRVELLRWDMQVPGTTRWEVVGGINLPDSAASPSTFTAQQLAKEIYVVDMKRDGSIVWSNLLRAAITEFANSKNVFLHTNPEHFAPVHANAAYSDMALAMLAVPKEYLEFFPKQPASRCHPGGWRPPLVCGKVFVDFDDYWGVPLPRPEQRYANLSDSLRTLNDRDEDTIWPINWLKAFVGAVILKSSIKSPDLIYHEWMHEVEFDLVNGDLVPTIAERFRAKYNTLFRDRRLAFLDDGQRAMGYVSDYAESNHSEDWAETAMYYRFHGDTFRRLMATDKRMGSMWLIEKYNLMKEFYRSREFNDQGLPFTNEKTADLIAYMNTQRSDIHTVGDVNTEAKIPRNGFVEWRFANHIYKANQAGRSKLELWWSAGRQDFITVSTDQGKNEARAAGYSKIRDEGFVRATAAVGFKPLKLYWHNGFQDNVTVVEHDKTEALLSARGYVFIRIEGYVRNEADGDNTVPLRVFSKNYPDTDMATTANSDQIASFARHVPWRLQGHIFKQKKEGMVDVGLYYHDAKKDFTLAAGRWADTVVSEGYVLVQVEGYAYQSNTYESPVLLKLYQNSRTGDYAAVAEAESIRWLSSNGYSSKGALGYIAP